MCLPSQNIEYVGLQMEKGRGRPKAKVVPPKFSKIALKYAYYLFKIILLSPQNNICVPL
jgi:hypothetical protein